MWFLKLILYVYFFLFAYKLLTDRFVNPYTLIMVFGKKGCGKTTLLTKLAMQHLKKGWIVYSTVDIPDTYKLDTRWVGKFRPRANSVFLIDEVGMIWDNRDFKNFCTDVRDFFKLQRHYRCKVYLFSQTFDIDKKLRDLTDEMYLLTKKFRVFSVARRIRKFTTINNQATDGVSKIDEGFEFEPFFLPGSFKITFIPRYSAFFDSFEVMELPEFPRFWRPVSDFQLSMYSHSFYYKTSFRNALIRFFLQLSLLKLDFKYRSIDFFIQHVRCLRLFVFYINLWQGSARDTLFRPCRRILTKIDALRRRAAGAVRGPERAIRQRGGSRSE